MLSRLQIVYRGHRSVEQLQEQSCAAAVHILYALQALLATSGADCPAYATLRNALVAFS